MNCKCGKELIDSRSKVCSGCYKSNAWDKLTPDEELKARLHNKFMENALKIKECTTCVFSFIKSSGNLGCDKYPGLNTSEKYANKYIACINHKEKL